MADTPSSANPNPTSPSDETASDDAETRGEADTGSQDNLLSDPGCEDRSLWLGSLGATVTRRNHDQSEPTSSSALRVTFGEEGSGGVYSEAIPAPGLRHRRFRVRFMARASRTGIRVRYQIASRNDVGRLQTHESGLSRLTTTFTQIEDYVTLGDATVEKIYLRVFVRNEEHQQWFEMTDVELTDVTDSVVDQAPEAAPAARPRETGAAPTVIEVAPAAQPASMKARHWMLVFSFLLAVVAPTLVAGYYLYTHAADQYASTVAFTVRQEESGSALEVLGGLRNLSGASSTDTDVLYQFIQSQELVQAVDRDLDLRSLYRKPEYDPVFTLTENASIEELVEYWTRMVRILYDPGTGLMEVETRAFEAADAKAISESIFRYSGDMINELSAIARADLTRYAKEELDLAIERLKEARRALTLFRNETQIVDPGADIQGQMGLLNSLQAQLAETLIEQDLLRETARANDPRLEQAKLKIEVIEKRIGEERRKLGVSGQHGDTGAFADLVGTFESLQVDRQFAEEAYVSALSAYDSAVAEARRQSRYLAAYVRPTLAQTPQYPRREILLVLTALVMFGIWAILSLVFYSLRDRR
ncbi:capsule biosynthesis protein [Ruegeria pomeroyi]|uniref:capsule biosynthesis protein n=1 Tax=Ruegeria pomeroyi TaxID=89184 RepID=UPI001F1C0AF2|nr:capsule biosynthesis protein [Ruegeria pomeroyi]